MNGKVGPFFYLAKDIYCDAKDTEDAEKYGDFKTWGDHSEFWDVLSKRNPDLAYIEYFKCPRGRVTYNYVKNLFYIYLNPKLNKEVILKKILKKFNIEGLNFVVDDTDVHYQ